MCKSGAQSKSLCQKIKFQILALPSTWCSVLSRKGKLFFLQFSLPPFFPSILMCIPQSSEIHLSKVLLQSISFALSKDFNGSWLPNKLNTKRLVWNFRAFVFCIPSTFLVLTSITSLISWVPAKPSLLVIIQYAPYSYFVPFSIKKTAREKAWNFPQGPVNFSNFMHSHFPLDSRSPF